MSTKRCILHKTHLEDFKDWLREVEQTPYRDGKGPFQELQVFVHDHGWQVIFSKANMPEHFSVNEKLLPTVRRFYAYRKGEG